LNKQKDAISVGSIIVSCALLFCTNCLKNTFDVFQVKSTQRRFCAIEKSRAEGGRKAAGAKAAATVAGTMEGGYQVYGRVRGSCV
jgi:hypothetical protein